MVIKPNLRNKYMEENKKVETVARRVVTISKKKFIWIIVLVILFVCWTGLELIKNRFSIGSMNTDYIVPTSFPYESNSKSINGTSMPYHEDSYRYQEQNPSISDTREFMKINYNATIKTRDVEEVVKEVKNIVKGADGRIDNYSSSEKYGYVRFIVAKSKFDAFKDEIESITHKKLYTESVSSQNLLGQKQGIEEETTNTAQSLESLIIQKTDLLVDHTKTVNSINKELAKIESDLAKVRIEIENPDKNSIILSLYSRESLLVDQQKFQKQKLSEENKNFQIKNQNLDNLINNQNSNLTNLNKQDNKFTNNIETVDGYINVNWVSIWEMVVIFSPIHPIWIIIILIVFAIILFRKKFPIVTFV